MKTTARLIIILVLLTSAVGLGKNIHSQASKFKEIYQVESEVKDLTSESKELNKKLGEEKDSFFLEKQARDKLGYQRKGEILYVVPTKENKTKENKEESRENWQRWADLILR
jgi:cell division protein FtsB